jgi:hypothetical protein
VVGDRSQPGSPYTFTCNPFFTFSRGAAALRRASLLTPSA